MEQVTPRESKLAISAQLTKAAWRTLKLDKELLVASILNVITGTLCFVLFVIAAYFLLPQVLGVSFTVNNNDIVSNLVYYGVTAIYLFITYAAANFFSGAIAHAALERFRGNDPTLSGSLAAASSKLGPILAFSGLQATVGLVLNILSDRLPFAGKIATWVAGAAWGIATMFAIPVIMDGKETGPLKTVRRSAKTLTQVWGESLFVGVALGVIEIAITLFTVFALVGGIALSIALSTWVFGIIGAALFVVGLSTLMIVMMTLRTIVTTAAYYYASTQQVPAGFDGELIRSMFRPKQKWFN